MVGARSVPGNLYDGHTLAEALEQAAILSDVKPEVAIVERLQGCRRRGREDLPPRIAARYHARAARDRACHRSHEGGRQT